jgi:hypothetical protein
MKNLILTTALVALTATAAIAGGGAEVMPDMQEAAVEKASSSNAGKWIPIMLLAILAYVLTKNTPVEPGA